MINLFSITLPDAPHPMPLYTMIKDFAPVVISIIVGAFASYFAWRQWRLGKEKLNLDLFDKRLAAYNGFLDKVRNDVGDASLSQEEYSAALQKKGTIEFLFPQHLRDEFAEIERLSIKWAAKNKRWLAIRDKDYPAEREEREKLSEDSREIRDAYDAKIADLPSRLASIMNFDDIRR